MDALNVAAEINGGHIGKKKSKSNSRSDSYKTISLPDVSTLKPTTNYNNSILEDICILPLTVLSKQLICHPTYQKATILLKVIKYIIK